MPLRVEGPRTPFRKVEGGCLQVGGATEGAMKGSPGRLASTLSDPNPCSDYSPGLHNVHKKQPTSTRAPINTGKAFQQIKILP